MGYWPKHPNKELEAILQEAHDQGWTIKLGKKYYRILCSCGKGHSKTVHKTPNQNYYKYLIFKLRSATCWEVKK